MLIPDLDLGRRFVAAQSIPGRSLIVAVTGAHLYGFPSPDSDLDLKGFHVARTESLLGLDRPDETFDRLAVFEGEECDLTSHEVGKALSLLLGGNGNVLEQIASTLQLFDTAETPRLRSLASGAVSKRFAAHYRGFFRGMQREHLRERRVKTMLYSYRVALTGIHLLRSGEVEANLVRLAPLYGFEDALILVERKAQGAEKGLLDEAEDAHHRSAWLRLGDQLDTALADSVLPEDPANRAEVHEFLVDLRLAELGRRN